MKVFAGNGPGMKQKGRLFRLYEQRNDFSKDESETTC